MKKHPILIIVIGFVSMVFLGVMVLGGLYGLTTGGPAFDTEPVVIVEIKGPIFESLDTLKELREYQDNRHVKAIVLRLDSPGGAVAPSQEIFEQVLKLKKEKKVVVSMGTMAASGAYYIAVAADKIVANPGTMTGSIGVIMESFGLQGLAQKISLEPRVIKSGDYKDVGNPFRPVTDEEKAYLQGITDNMYGQFLSAVSSSRGIDIEKMKALAGGKVYTGQQALDLGLVDQLGNLYDALSLAKGLAGLSEDAAVRWPKQPSLLEKLATGEGANSLINIFFKQFGLLQMPLFFSYPQGGFYSPGLGS